MSPRSTYRLQLGPDLGFADARRLVPRLARLGVDHLYLSPVLQAVPGSTHGYDVADHTRLSGDLGGRPAFDELATAADEAGLGIVVDIVPNHMSIASPSANRWWWDVLENGPASRYAAHFDINWESPESRQEDTVLLPILGDHYGKILEARELRLERGGAGFVVRYFDHVLPLSPRSVVALLRPLVGVVDEPELGFVVDALAHLPMGHGGELGRDVIERRHRDLTVLKRLLAGLLVDDAVSSAVDERLAAASADDDLLHEILERQHYQLAHWRRGLRDLDYRRFFDIDTLIGLRIEDPRVFDDTHRLLLELVASGAVHGLRVDHPDGLTDPGGYLARLADASGGVWTVVEKILEPAEHLPGWSVAGTTGYDFAHAAGGVFRDPRGLEAIVSHWSEEVDAADWETTVDRAKHEVLRTVLASDVVWLADLGLRVCEHDRRHRDYTRHDLTQAVRSLVASYPVYRTYVRPGLPPTDEDRAVIEASAKRAAERDEVAPDLLEFLVSVLTGEHAGNDLADEFMRRFQQLTGPAMAKSVEDTAFYRYLPLASANEVGGNPGDATRSVAELHEHNERMHRDWPTTMTTLSTHDTKRSADVRARLDALTERAAEWTDLLSRWVPRIDDWWTVDPDRRTTVLALQTMVGAWPIDRDRLVQYLEKATKEAKLRTSWTDGDPAFDAALGVLVERLFDDESLRDELGTLVETVTLPGRRNSLALHLLLLASPGVPDLYQGNELWDLSLVDPDNRRPVDHELRSSLLQQLQEDGGPQLPLADDDVGIHKLWLVHRALDLRNRRPASFGPGPAGRYERLSAGDHVVAFGRGDDVVVAAATRSGPSVGSVDLPAGEWTDVLTGDMRTGAVPVDPVLLVERSAS